MVASDNRHSGARPERPGLAVDLRIIQLHHQENLNQRQGHCQRPIHVTVSIIEGHGDGVYDHVVNAGGLREKEREDAVPDAEAHPGVVDGRDVDQEAGHLHDVKKLLLDANDEEEDAEHAAGVVLEAVLAGVDRDVDQSLLLWEKRLDGVPDEGPRADLLKVIRARLSDLRARRRGRPAPRSQASP